MNPTVSVSKSFRPPIIKDLVVVESVVNKFSDVSLLSRVSELNRVVLPELVYPTRETMAFCPPLADYGKDHVFFWILPTFLK